MTNKNRRFELLLSEGSVFQETGVIQILRDKETGVHYLIARYTHGIGVTTLLDEEGKPVID